VFAHPQWYCNQANLL